MEEERRERHGAAEWAARFRSPERKYRSRPFWSWNDDLSVDEIVRQVREMADKGMGGFFMHSREGLETPYMGEQWFSCILAAVREAEKHQMTAWLYDEDRWPSGTAAGQVPAMGDRNRLKGLTMEIVDWNDGTWDAIWEEIFDGNIAWEESAACRKDGTEVGTWKFCEDAAKEELPEDGLLLAAYAAEIDGMEICSFRRLYAKEDGYSNGEERKPGSCSKARELGSCGTEKQMEEGKKNRQVLLLVRLERSGPSAWFQNETPPDNLNPDTVREFLKKTHDVYFEKAGDYFGQVIPGIFTDEPSLADRHAAFSPNRGWIPWTFGFSGYYQAKWGQDVYETLPYIYFNGEGSRMARYRYWETVSDRFSESYSKTIADWCHAHGIAYTGHFLQEFRLGLCARVNGSVMPHYRYQDVPGIDMLGEDTCEYVTVKQCTSVAHQYGKQEVLTETYGCTGWDFTFEGMKWIGDWQYVLGVNARCPHLAWYSMRGMRKRDYPPCFSHQNTWWEKYAVTEDYFARLGMTLQEGEPVRKLLVIHPMGTAWTRLGCSPYGNPVRSRERDVPAIDQYGMAFNRMIEELSRMQIDYDLGDETLMEADGAVLDGRLRVGLAAYQAVLVPPVDTLCASTVSLLSAFAAQGGSIFLVRPVPCLVAGAADESGMLEKLLAHPACCKYDDLQQAAAAMKRAGLATVGVEGADGEPVRQVLVQLRKTVDGGILFLVNNDRERGYRFRVTVPIDELIPEAHAAAIEACTAASGACTAAFETCGAVSGSCTAGFEGNGWEQNLYLLEAQLLTGKTVRREAELVCAEETGQALVFDCELSGCGSALYRIVWESGGSAGCGSVNGRLDKWAAENVITAGKMAPAGRRIIYDTEAFQTLQHGENAYVLDTCRWRFAGETHWSQEMEIWQAQREIRRSLEMRVNDSSEEIQRYSWVWRNDLKQGRRVELKLDVFIQELPKAVLWFAGEGLQDPENDGYAIFVNGRRQEIKAEVWKTDRCFGKTALNSADWIRKENEILVSLDYRETTELENFFLLGAFGVYRTEDQGRVIRKQQETIGYGDWTKQGLLHYADCVTYVYRICVPQEQQTGRYLLKVGRFEGTCAEVKWNGNVYPVPWKAAAEIVLEDGELRAENQLEITVCSSLRNLFGPFHLAGKKPKAINGACFMVCGANHTSAYQTVPYGLMEPPEIWTCE